MDENKIPENVSFETDNEMEIVEAKKENLKAKLPVIIVFCILVIAIISGFIIYSIKNKTPDTPNEDVSGNNFSTEDTNVTVNQSPFGEINTEDEYVSWRDQLIADSTTQLSDKVGSESPNEIIEPTTSDSQTIPESSAVDTQQVAQAEKQIKAFFNKKYHMKGAMYDNNGDGDSFSISQNGENLEAMSNLDGIEVSIMRLDGVIYFKRPALNQYAILTEALMNFMGLDADFTNFSFGDVNYDAMKNKLVGVYDVTINNAPGVCYLYKTNTQQFKFFAQDGNLKQIEIYDETGKLTSQMMISYFTTSIPSGHLTLKGYTETSFGTLFGDVLKEES